MASPPVDSGSTTCGGWTARRAERRSAAGAARRARRRRARPDYAIGRQGVADRAAASSTCTFPMVRCWLRRPGRRSLTMPRQNRVTPLGELIADPARGLVYGNRGCLHDAAGRIRPRHADAALDRVPAAVPRLAPRAAAAAGPLHRAVLPRRGDRVRRRAPPVRAVPPRRLRPLPGADRRAAAPTRSTCACTPSGVDGRAAPPRARGGADLPDGAFVLRDDGAPWLVRGDALLRWTPAGYAERRRAAARRRRAADAADARRRAARGLGRRACRCCTRAPASAAARRPPPAGGPRSGRPRGRRGRSRRSARARRRRSRSRRRSRRPASTIARKPATISSAGGAEGEAAGRWASSPRR